MPKQKKTFPAKSSAKKIEKRTSKLPDRILGMRDAMAAEGKFWDFVHRKAHDIARGYSFSYVKAPVIESADLYKKSLRDETGRDFYQLECDKGERGILRPELTQGILRAYFQQPHEGDQLAPLHAYSIGPVFRREKLQSGHYREFNQLDFEIIGEGQPMSEAILIVAAVNFFKELHINVQVQINSLGKAECRKEYAKRLSEFYRERGKKTKVCNSCKKNLLKNQIALLDCREEECIKLRSEAPQIADYWSDDSREHFKQVMEYLDELNIPYNFDPYLVRNLNYYNDTVFEIWPTNDDGDIQGKLALAGGGRYDYLNEQIGGQPIQAVGIAIGMERAVAKVRDRNIFLGDPEEDLIFIAQLGNQAKIKALMLFEELRNAGLSVRQSFAVDSLKVQIEEAQELHARYSLILGKKEVMDETIQLRDMESGVQEVVAFKKIKEKLLKKINLNNRKEGGLYG
jgi:histidyl-tRNA synthetase